MTDKTQPWALMLADRLHHEQPTVLRIDAEHAGEELRRQHARIAELEAQLEAIGAGGVSGPLMGRASLAASAGSEPAKRVFLVATGEEHEGEATYTRYDDAPPPLCDSECLYTHPSPPEGMVMVPADALSKCKVALERYSQVPSDYHLSVLRLLDSMRELILASCTDAPPTTPAGSGKGE